MAYRALLRYVADDVPGEYAHFATPGAGILVCDPPAVYRPRHPEAQVFYQVFEQHFDSYVAAYEERFEARSGPLRRVVRDSVEQFLACGRLQGGFARLRCPSCESEHLIAFSCRARCVCSSCQAKRAALFAEKLASEIGWAIVTGASCQQVRKVSAGACGASAFRRSGDAGAQLLIRLTAAFGSPALVGTHPHIS